MIPTQLSNIIFKTITKSQNNISLPKYQVNKINQIDLFKYYNSRSTLFVVDPLSPNRLISAFYN